MLQLMIIIINVYYFIFVCVAHLLLQAGERRELYVQYTFVYIILCLKEMVQRSTADFITVFNIAHMYVNIHV